MCAQEEASGEREVETYTAAKPSSGSSSRGEHKLTEKKSQKISFTSQAEAIHTKIKCAVAVIAIRFARYFLQLLTSS